MDNKRYNLEILETEILECLGITKEKLFKTGKKNEMVFSRAAVFYFLRKHTNLTYEFIGERYNRDHATVMYALKHFDLYKTLDEAFSLQVQAIENRLRDKPKIIVCGHCGREL